MSDKDCTGGIGDDGPPDESGAFDWSWLWNLF